MTAVCCTSQAKREEDSPRAGSGLPEILDISAAVVGIPSRYYRNGPPPFDQPTTWSIPAGSKQDLPDGFVKSMMGSMSVKCKTCGEVHLGVINRCWKCGGEMKVDEIKRAQQDSNAPEGMVAAETAAGADAENSPFASGPAVGKADGSRAASANRSLATGLLIASFVVGGSALLASRSTGWTIIPAIIGLGCAAASLQYRRSWLVVLAMLICLVALVVSSMTAYDSLEQIYQLEFQQGDGF